MYSDLTANSPAHVDGTLLSFFLHFAKLKFFFNPEDLPGCAVVCGLFLLGDLALYIYCGSASFSWIRFGSQF